MLMKTNAIDYFRVEPHHAAIHERLENWASWVQVRQPSWISPIWKLGKSNGRQWHQPEHRPNCDILDAQFIEKAVYKLPEKHRAAIRWCYVYRYGELKFRREHGLTPDGLMRLLRDARQMLINRLDK